MVINASASAMASPSSQRIAPALLLRDAVGDKIKSGSLLNAFRKRKESVPVLRGSLLSSAPSKETAADGKPVYNYRVNGRGEDIMMYCSEQDVAPITLNEFKLLLGIKSPVARYEAFVNDILDWGSKLKVNDTVYVSLPSQQITKRCRAVVRWIGRLPGEDGTRFGVELLVSSSFQYSRHV